MNDSKPSSPYWLARARSSQAIYENLDMVMRQVHLVEIERLVRRMMPVLVSAFGTAKGLADDRSSFSLRFQRELFDLFEKAHDGRSRTWRKAVMTGTRAGVIDTRAKGEPVVGDYPAWADVLMRLVELEMDAREMQLRRDQANVWHLPVGPRHLSEAIVQAGTTNNEDDVEVA